MEEPEIVYSVFDYWDGPRSGIAEYHGKPHFYWCIFDEAADEWSDVFRLSPIDEGGIPLTGEEWQDWHWWKHSYGQGKAKIEAQPERYASYAPVIETLFQAFASNPAAAGLKAVGGFEVFTDLTALSGTARLWRVRWLPLETVENSSL